MTLPRPSHLDALEEDHVSAEPAGQRVLVQQALGDGLGQGVAVGVALNHPGLEVGVDPAHLRIQKSSRPFQLYSSLIWQYVVR